MRPGRGPSRARRPPSRHPRPASGPAVELAVRDGVAWLTLARPGSGNRLDAELLGALVEASAAAEDDDGARVPRPINFSVNYLRSVGPRATRARAEIVKHGRRIANVRVVAWQDDVAKPVAAGIGNFLL